MGNNGTKSGSSCLPNSPRPLPGREEVGNCEGDAGLAASNAACDLGIEGNEGNAIDTLCDVDTTVLRLAALGRPGLAMLDRVRD